MSIETTTGSAGDLHHQGHDDRRDAYSATALATTDSSLSGAERPDPRVLSGGPTAKLHRLSIVMIRVLLGLDTPKPSTRKALVSRGLFLVADQHGGAVISPEGVNVVAHMVTEYDQITRQESGVRPSPGAGEGPMATGQEEETPEVTQEISAVGDRHMEGKCRERVGTHCHCTCESGMPEGTRRPCQVCEPGRTEPVVMGDVHGPDLPPEPLARQSLARETGQVQSTYARPVDQDDPALAELWALLGGDSPASRDRAGAEHLARPVDLNARNTVEGSKIVRGMVVHTPVIGKVAVSKVQTWEDTVHVQGKDDAGRPVELSLPSNHRITLVGQESTPGLAMQGSPAELDAPEQLTLV